MFTRDNITNYDLGKIYLTIQRENSKVIYNLKSCEINCREWLENIINKYNQNKNCKFKNKIKIIGREYVGHSFKNLKCYLYSHEMWVLNWLLIEKLNCCNYTIVNGDELLIPYKYVLDELKLFKLQDDLYLSVSKDC